MDSFDLAFQFLMKHEGSELYKRDGEFSKYGITSTFVKSRMKIDPPEEFVERLTEAEAAQVYQVYFWERTGICRIQDQAVAAKCLDATVNMGPGGVNGTEIIKGGITLLQMACNAHLAYDERLHVDGTIGPKTMAATATIKPAALMQSYVQFLGDYYRAIVRVQPFKQHDLKGWLARAEDIPATNPDAP